MKKYEVLKKIERERMIAIIRVSSEEEAERALDALVEGGLHCVELTFTTPYAHSILEKLTKRFEGSGLMLGAGSVLDAETARIAILSGACYLVTPTFSAETVRLANRYGVPVFSGVCTPTEALSALESGVEAVKLFPASSYAPKVVKDWKAPLPNLEIIPTGGVDVHNIADWLKAGAFACGVGGSLFAGLKEGNYRKITERAEAFVDVIRKTAVT